MEIFIVLIYYLTIIVSFILISVFGRDRDFEEKFFLSILWPMYILLILFTIIEDICEYWKTRKKT